MTPIRHIAVRMFGAQFLRAARVASSAVAEPRPTVATSGPGLALVSSHTGGLYRIVVDGELDLATVGLLESAVASAYGSTLRRRSPSELVLDLTDVTFLDVIAITSLGRIHDLSQSRGRFRVGIPAHRGPRRMLSLAVDYGWIAPLFRPDGPYL